MWCLIACLLGLVEPAADLLQDGRDARRAQLPILVYVSRSDCTFCRRFEAEVLDPLIRSGVVAERIIIRELVWDLPEPVIDFRGRSVTPETLADAYHAKLTPTLLFLDPDGNEIVARITGYDGSDYYSYYLETAISSAAAAVMHRDDRQHNDKHHNE